MVNIVVFVNVFFAPIVALLVYYKMKRLTFTPTFIMLYRYMIFVVLNLPLAKVGVVVVKYIIHREIYIDSGYYTVCAVIAALFLPRLLQTVHWMYEHRNTFLRERLIPFRQKLFAAALSVGISLLAYLIVGPVEIFSGNMDELLFELKDFFPWLLLIAAGLLLVSSFLISLLPDWPFRIVSSLILAFGAASWVQYMFLNIRLLEAGGGLTEAQNVGTFSTINTVIWIVILIVLFILLMRFKNWISLSSIISGGLCLVQLVGVISAVVTIPDREYSVLSGAEQMELATDENIIVLMFDTTDVGLINDMFQSYPETKEIVKDFQWYVNADNHYFYTYPSYTNILTGCAVDFSIRPKEWLNAAWSSERTDSFYQILSDSGYKKLVYEYTYALNNVFGKTENLRGKFDNVVKSEFRVSDRKKMLKNFVKLSAYRCLPYSLKEPFEVLTSEFGSVSEPISITDVSYFNYQYYDRLRTEGLSINPDVDKLFLFQNLEGAHLTCHTAADGTHAETPTTQAETMRGVFSILDEYIRQMKALEKYDDSTIIIMGDHGRGPDYAEGKLYQPMCFIKLPGETHDQFQINTAPIYWDDFQATVLELIGQNDGSFGTSFFDWNPGDMRDRTIYLGVTDDEYSYYSFTHQKDGTEIIDSYINGNYDRIYGPGYFSDFE